MPITVVCQGIVRFDKDTGQYVRCGAAMQAADALAGKPIRCPSCGEETIVPRDAAPTGAASMRAPAAPGQATPAPAGAPAPTTRTAARPASGTTTTTSRARVAAPSPTVPPSPAPPPPVTVQKAAPSGEETGFALEDSPPDGAATPNEKVPSFSPWSSPPVAEATPSAPPAPFTPPAPLTIPAPAETEESDDPYSLRPEEDAPRPTSFLHPLAPSSEEPLSGQPYQAVESFRPGAGTSPGEQDEEAERAVHSGWCDNCGHDMPAAATLCPKCGYQHGAAHVVFRKEPTPPPSMQICPKCNTQLPPGMLLCEECGYHTGLKQQFPALAKRSVDTGEPPPTGLDQWVSRQVVGGGPSPKHAMRWVLAGAALFAGLGALTVTGILFLMMGAWAICLVVPAGMLFAAAVIGFFFYQKKNAAAAEKGRKGVEQAIWSSMLVVLRAIGWRSIAPPFSQFRMLDVRNTAFGDADLTSLKNPQEYEVLDLEGTRVTDAALPYMAAMPKLKFLSVRRTGVTEQGAWNLQRAKTDLWLWY